MGLHNGGRAIDVDHQAGEKVAFAVDESEGGVVFACEAKELAQPEGVFKPFGVEGFINVASVEIEYSDGDAADLVMAGSDEPSVMGENLHGVALFEVMGEWFGESSGENPGVKAVKRLLFPAFEP